MENYIVINGKKAELTKEQLEKLGIEIKGNPFERGIGNRYYYINWDGEVTIDVDEAIDNDDKSHDVANYCRDKELMEQRALHETLNRLLWRFSMQNGGDEIDWNDVKKAKWLICFDHINKQFNTICTYTWHASDVHFISQEVAQRAIDEIIKPFMTEHPDFVW